MKILCYILGAFVLQGYAVDDNNVFDSTYYEGTYYNGNIRLPPIRTKFYDELNTTLTGDFTEYFWTLHYSGEITIHATGPIPYYKIQNKTHFIMKLIAFKNDNKMEWATIVTTIEKDIIEFNPVKYYANVTTTFRGIILVVNATVDSNQAIHYELDLHSDLLKKNLQIDDSGVIRVISALPPGHYVFKVIASTKLTSNYITSVIDVYKNYQLQPLLIRSITEHYSYYDVLKEYVSPCEYEITDSWPYPQTWFEIVDNKLSTSGVDRENETIAFMPVSQVLIELTCKNHLINNKQPQYSMIGFANHRSMESPSCDLNITDRNWVFTKEMSHPPNKRLISIIVEDINDHKPEFHTDNPLTVGYPDSELINFIRPQSLVTVHATDKDICLNAKIKYSTNNDVFDVHPETGVVYPPRNALTFLVDHSVITISATDQDGHGRSTNQYIQVRLLNLKHIVVISMKYHLIEDVPDIIYNISSNIGVSVNSIESFMSPINVNNPAYELMERYVNLTQTTSLIMFIYGITKEGNVLDADKLKSMIKQDAPWILESSILIESDFYNAINLNTGLIVAVSLLSVILFSLLALIFLWYYIIMPTKYQRIESPAFQPR